MAVQCERLYVHYEKSLLLVMLADRRFFCDFDELENYFGFLIELGENSEVNHTGYFR